MENNKISKDKDITAEKILDEIEGNKNLKESDEKQNKQLRNIFIGVGLFVMFIILLFLINYLATNSKYEEVKFNEIREGNLLLYHTSIPLFDNVSGEYYADYNFYLRNNPKKLKEVEFNGTFVLKDFIVINSEEDYNCDGDGIIAIVNLKNLYEATGATMIKDEKASCDPFGRYTYLSLKAGNETEIQQISESCYVLSVNNCEILEVTERYMLEMFIDINKNLKN